jgi:predicted acyltransferase
MGVAARPADRQIPVSVPGAIAALLAAAITSYILLVIGQGVGHQLGRIFIFVPSFVAILAIACGAGALTRRPSRRAAFFGMSAAGFGMLGGLWIWIRLFTIETGLLLLIAAGLAVVALAGAVNTNSRRRPASLSAAMGAGRHYSSLVEDWPSASLRPAARPVAHSTSTVGTNRGRPPTRAVTDG